MNDKVFNFINNFLTKNPVIPWRVGIWVARAYLYGRVNINNERHWDKRFKEHDYASSDEKPLRDFVCNQIRKNEKVLDVGCGDGFILKKLKKTKSKHLFGLDISKVAIDGLRKVGIQGKVSKLPEISLPENSFDVVICTEVLEHLHDDKKTVENMLRVLTSGGRLFVSVPNNCMGPDAEPEHLRKYARNDLKSLLNDLKNLKFKVFEPRILAYGYKK